MKKIMNDPATFVDDAIDGILRAHPSLVAVNGDRRTLARVDAKKTGRVSILTGGGSGHLPLFLGYVGPGLCTGVAIGNVFSSPSGDQIADLTRAVDNGAGVLYLYGNYGGDVMNFDLAAELVADDGIRCETVLGIDDALSAARELGHERRGIAGLVLAYKCAGAAAESGATLDEVADVAREAVASMRTAGVGLEPAVLPHSAAPTFELGAGEMEIGIGIHGERGAARVPLEDAESICRRLLDPILDELDLVKGDEVAVLVNGLGATSLEELYILYRATSRRLDEVGVAVTRSLVGEYVTSLEMAGASITLLKLSTRLKGLLDQPGHSPFVDLVRS